MSKTAWMGAAAGALALGLAVGTRAQEPGAAAVAPAVVDTSPGAVFEQAWRITKVAFYDEGMRGVDWDGVLAELRPRAEAARTPAELSAVINGALGRLKASHTAHYHPDQREYYEILDVFFPTGVPERADSKIEPGPVEYVGIGLASRAIDGRVFVAEVYAGGPADKAGILAGDELVAVEGGAYSDVEAFRGREGRETRVTIQRAAEAESRREVVVTPVRIRPREMFLAAVKTGSRVIEREGKKVAYVRVISYAHPDYHEAVKELLWGEMKDADALVLDIRGGWGGASPAYMDLFNPVAPSLEQRNRDGEVRRFDGAWRKPAVMLIDGGSRSGKEVLAYAFKKHRCGTLVGERTAGAVLAGTLRPLADGSVLYVAVAEVRVDGKVLEGIGVEPDVTVARELPYSAGRDPQVEAAVAEAARAAGR